MCMFADFVASVQSAGAHGGQDPAYAGAGLCRQGWVAWAGPRVALRGNLAGLQPLLCKVHLRTQAGGLQLGILHEAGDVGVGGQLEQVLRTLAVRYCWVAWLAHVRT